MLWAESICLVNNGLEDGLCWFTMLVIIFILLLRQLKYEVHVIQHMQDPRYCWNLPNNGGFLTNVRKGPRNLQDWVRIMSFTVTKFWILYGIYSTLFTVIQVIDSHYVFIWLFFYLIIIFTLREWLFCENWISRAMTAYPQIKFSRNALIWLYF